MTIEARRAEVDAKFYAPKIETLTRLYPYNSTTSVLGGVPIESFQPKEGIAPENLDRVLMNLHGGAFLFGGGGPGGAAESIPMAGLGRIKVISVDYRMAPEHRFPAANEDVVAVYRELLRVYRPENIGIYGYSAGGALAGQAIAWFKKERLPMPGAIGILCASTHRYGEGDPSQLWPRTQSTQQIESILPNPEQLTGAAYFEGANPTDPLAVPAASMDVLRLFPPTLFVTGSRAYEMSSAARSHLELIELGVSSQLALFDGMDHGFVLYPIPEATRAHRIVATFFQHNLGARHAVRSASACAAGPDLASL